MPESDVLLLLKGIRAVSHLFYFGLYTHELFGILIVDSDSLPPIKLGLWGRVILCH